MTTAAATSAALLVAAALAGCAGKQFVPPPEGTPGVAIATYAASRSSASANVQVLQFNTKGCYVGYTNLPREDRGGKEGIRLPPGEERFFQIESRGSNDICRSVVSFTPEAGATYRLVELSVSSSRLFEARMCGLSVERVPDDSGRKDVATRHWTMKQASVKCFRAVP